jgi:uroporphyrinogen-III synthase
MLTGPKTVLMIRAYDQAVDFVSELAVTNPVIFAPMVCIEPLNTDQTLPSIDRVIFTSSNAVRLFANKTKNRSMDVACVGSITARAAAEFGFKTPQLYETAAQLVTSIQRDAHDGARILYPRAETVSLDIANELTRTDYDVTDMIIYRQTFQPLSHNAINLIESSSVVVPIFSMEIAKRFHEAIVSIKLHNLTLVCISSPVAAVFDGFSVEIAPKPTRAALITRIKTCLSA